METLSPHWLILLPLSTLRLFLVRTWNLACLKERPRVKVLIMERLVIARMSNLALVLDVMARLILAALFITLAKKRKNTMDTTFQDTSRVYSLAKAWTIQSTIMYHGCRRNNCLLTRERVTQASHHKEGFFS